MGVSRNRKNHKQKANKRKNEIALSKRRQEKAMAEFRDMIMKQVAANQNKENGEQLVPGQHMITTEEIKTAIDQVINPETNA
jgi:hypothetical protein